MNMDRYLADAVKSQIDDLPTDLVVNVARHTLQILCERLAALDAANTTLLEEVSFALDTDAERDGRVPAEHALDMRHLMAQANIGRYADGDPFAVLDEPDSIPPDPDDDEQEWNERLDKLRAEFETARPEASDAEVAEAMRAIDNRHMLQ